MKAEEKSLIYNLLKTASGNINGYTTLAFSAPEPEWKDDSVVENIENSVISEQISSDFIQQPSEAEAVNETVEIPSESTEEKIQPPVDNLIPVTNTSRLTIDDIAAKIARCTRCTLARTRNNVVPGMGVNNPDVMVIGEGPGYDEDKQGLPFVGKAGFLLDKMLAAIGLDRKTNCYIANIVKCRPPQNRDPFPAEQDACFSFLEAQINILKPKMILCMGKVAGNKILNMEAPVGQIRGEFHDYNGIPVLVTYHPSALLRNEELKKPAWEDLKRFKAKLDLINQ